MYMRHIRDWREATLMLSFEEKGYYDELLNLIYLYDDLLADNDDFICRAMPVNKKLHLRLKAALLKAGLIQVKDGFYFNKRASEEVAKINGISEKNRVKAHNRWAKSAKNKNKTSAAAEPNDEVGGSTAMLNQKVNSDSDSDSESDPFFIKNKRANRRPDNANRNRGIKRSDKCAIGKILNPDGEIPKEYLEYAKERGLNNPERVFLNWASWWVSENGHKAGANGWYATWKARVRKDVDRQLAGSGNSAGGNRPGMCATTEGARLALNRRRNRARKI